MADMLHELENNEAILLMYIAGELPDEERREVEQMLSSDAALRATHDELRGLWDSAMSGIERLDAGDAPPMKTEVAARQVGRLVRQWHAARALSPAKKAEPVVASGRRLAWWQTAAAAAAVMFLGFLVYWGWTDSPGTQQPPLATTGPAQDGYVVDTRLPGVLPVRGASFVRGLNGNTPPYRVYDPDNANEDGYYLLPYYDPTSDPDAPRVADARSTELDRQMDSLRFLTSPSAD